jgi:NTE family protein
MLDVAVRSITIMSSRISRSRLAGDPAEVLLLPKLGHIGLMEFHRAKEAIAEGQAEIEKNQAQILDIKQKIK